MFYARFLDALSWAATLAPHNLKRMLIIGPGITDPVDELLEMYPSSQIVLVELEGKTVQQLEGQYGGIDRLHIITGDAGHLSEFAPGPYDLTIIRHPDVARFGEKWVAALASSIAALRNDGLLIVTCYSLPEAAFVDEVLHEKPVFLHPGSPYTTVSVDLQGNDRYILIFAKRS